MSRSLRIVDEGQLIGTVSPSLYFYVNICFSTHLQVKLDGHHGNQQR